MESKLRAEACASLTAYTNDNNWAISAESTLYKCFGWSHEKYVIETINLAELTRKKKIVEIDVEQFCTMSKRDRLVNTDDFGPYISEMTRAELERQMLEQDCEQALQQMAGVLSCSKCGKNRISINQKQSRAADEGMTLYCLCDSCGHAWKM